MWKFVGSPCLQYFSGGKRQATLPFKPLKKVKKRNPWSDSGSDSETDFEVPPKRERVVRQAAGECNTNEGWSVKEKIEETLQRAPRA